MTSDAHRWKAIELIGEASASGATLRESCGEIGRGEAESERKYWNGVFQKPDPWNYRVSEYEAVKYQQTLEVVADTKAARAIEYGCAEGMFTRMLADYVESLIAVDISDTALDRARVACKDKANIAFTQHDISRGALGSNFDLVLCCEILYYLEDEKSVVSFASSLAQSLSSGGYLITTHANIVSDDKGATGFDFNAMGAVGFGRIFSSHPAFQLISETRTDLYRVQKFKRVRAQPNTGQNEEKPVPTQAIELQIRHHAAAVPRGVKVGGCLVTEAEARHLWQTEAPPILMFHRVGCDGPLELAPYRISADLFERHLALLQRHGYTCISLAAYHNALTERNPAVLPGKIVVLTFDDAYRDFHATAMPLLMQYGFSATVFVPSSSVGGVATWDQHYGRPAEIMNWRELNELLAAGMEIGSHGSQHVRLTEISRAEAEQEVKGSKALLEEQLGTTIQAFSYPFTAIPSQHHQLLRDAGYCIGVGGGDYRLDTKTQDPYALPRIEVRGDCSVEELFALLPPCLPAEEESIVRFHELTQRRHRSLYLSI